MSKLWPVVALLALGACCSLPKEIRPIFETGQCLRMTGLDPSILRLLAVGERSYFYQFWHRDGWIGGFYEIPFDYQYGYVAVPCPEDKR